MFSLMTLSLTEKRLRLPHLYLKKTASYKFQARLSLVALMCNLFSKTTLLLMQEVYYMVVQ